MISYGRTANAGRRQRRRVTNLVATLGQDAEQCHEEVMDWRDHHVAHRVDRLRENVEIYAYFDGDERSLKRISVRVAPTLGPEEEGDDLINRFEKHIKALRDLLWQEHIWPLEKVLMAEQAGRIDELLTVAKPIAPARSEFAIDINPSGSVPN